MSRKIKTKVAVCVCLLLIIGSTSAIAVAASTALKGLLAKYEKLDEDEVMEKLSDESFTGICDEINLLSRNGVSLENLMYHASALAEKAQEVPVSELVRLAADPQNSESLRVIIVQLLADQGEALQTEELSRLQQMILDDKQSSLVRQNLVWALPAGEKTNQILETVVFQADEDLAFQALKRLNKQDPARAKKAAEALLQAQEDGEKRRSALLTISGQFAENGTDAEKDEWIAFCLSVLDAPENQGDALLRDTVLYALQELRYSKALYAILDREDVDDSYKAGCIGINYNVLIRTLQNNPTDYDIEMSIKALTLAPVDKAVEALQAAVEKSGKTYDLTPVLSQETVPALEAWKNR